MKYTNKLFAIFFSLMLFFGNVQNVSAVECLSVKLNETFLILEEGKTFQLKASTNPEECISDVVWTSTRPDVAKVDENGLVTAIKASPYQTTIKATVGDRSHSCSISVKEPEKEKITVTCQYVLNGKVVSPDKVKSGYTSPLKIQSNKDEPTDYMGLLKYGMSVALANSDATGPYYDVACTKKVGMDDIFNKDTTVYFKVVVTDTNSSNQTNNQTNTNKNETSSDKKNETTTNKNETTTNKTDKTDKTDTTNKNTTTDKKDETSNIQTNTDKNNQTTVTPDNTTGNDSNTGFVPSPEVGDDSQGVGNIDNTENKDVINNDAESPNVLPYVSGGIVLVGVGAGVFMMSKKKKINNR